LAPLDQIAAIFDLIELDEAGIARHTLQEIAAFAVGEDLVGQIAGKQADGDLAAGDSLARGIDDREVIGDETVKSVSREITFEEDTGDITLLAETLDSMAEELQAVLQQEHLRFRTVTVKVRDENFSTHTRSKTLGRYCDDGRILQEIAHALLKSSGTRGKVRLIGLRVSGFEPPGSRQATISEFYR